MTSAMPNGTAKLDFDRTAVSIRAKCLPCAPDYLRLTLASKVYEAVETTPLTRAEGLSWRLQCNVLLKREDTHSIGSYKVRGVYNMIAHLPERKRWKGVITYSRGNHGLAVAFSARKLRIPSMIVLPLDTPESVHQRLYRLRSTVIRYGSDIQAAKEECFRLQELYGLVYVPADDDALVIAGHGTIGPEILKQADVSRLEAIICPVTCEALIAGIGMYVKRVAPHVKIIGVERTEDDKLSRSLRLRGKTQSKDQIGSSRFKDETINIFAEVVDDIVLVDDQAISGATKEAFEDTKHILQPTGAMSIAGIKEWVKSNELVGSAVDIVAIASEANVDFSTIPSIIKQAAILEKAIVASALNS